MPLLFLHHVVDNETLWLYLWKKKEANGHSGAKQYYHQQNFMRDGLDV